MHKLFIAAFWAAGFLLNGCTRHHVTADTVHRVEIAPIFVTVDINLKVQRALDDALSFQGSLEDIFTPEELEQIQNPI